MVDALQGRFHENTADSRPALTVSRSTPIRCYKLEHIVLIGAGLLLTTACSEDKSAKYEPAIGQEEAVSDVWHQAKLRGVTFRAIGQEPGWHLEITHRDSIMISTDYGTKVSTYEFVEPIVYRVGRRTQYVIEDAKVMVEIRGEPCTDIMSGKIFEVSVSIIEEDRRLEGCGQALL